MMVLGPSDLPRWHRKGPRYAMPLDLQSLNCAARIVGDFPTRDGLVRGTIGTGFLLSVHSETHENFRFPYLVTAHHVIDGQTDIEAHIANPQTGVLARGMHVTDWHHPIETLDLAIAPVQP